MIYVVIVGQVDFSLVNAVVGIGGFVDEVDVADEIFALVARYHNGTNF